ADPGLGIGKLGDVKAGSTFDFDQGEIGARIGADHLGLIGTAVVGRHLNLARAIHDMVVGHRVAVGGDEEARTLARNDVVLAPQARKTVRPAKVAEKTLHWRIRRQAVTVLGELLTDVDLDRDDGGFDALDNVGKPGWTVDLAGLLVDLRKRGARKEIARRPPRPET